MDFSGILTGFGADILGIFTHENSDSSICVKIQHLLDYYTILDKIMHALCRI